MVCIRLSVDILREMSVILGIVTYLLEQQPNTTFYLAHTLSINKTILLALNSIPLLPKSKWTD